MPDFQVTYLIPREAPWIVQIGNFRYASCSEVCRLLGRLEDENTRLKKRLAPKPKKKTTKKTATKKTAKK